MALGVVAGALVRLVFGSAAGVPPAAHVRSALAALGVEVADLRPARGSASARRSTWAATPRASR